MDETPGNERRDLTSFLNGVARGDAESAKTLMPLVHDELRAIAASYLREKQFRHTLQPTALVHEAFLKLFDPQRVAWNDRKHFFALAAKTMRQILVDHARKQGRLKRGAERLRVTLDEQAVGADEPDVELLDLNDALLDLARHDERQGRIVELRFFGGLDVQEVADLLTLSKSTVEREWRAARAWLGIRLEGWHA
jgi:RNA polymerase sigma factor (TIGR02999 family)